MDLGARFPRRSARRRPEHFEGPELSQLVVVIAGINAWNRVMVAAGEQPPPIDD